jgi:SAM-dependent methyltransferase
MFDEPLTTGPQAYVLDTENPRVNSADLVRLILQDRALNEAIQPLLPHGFVPTPTSRIVDIACGPGGWCGRVAAEYPDVEIIGVDNNRKAINYAKSINSRENLHFEIQSIFDDQFQLHLDLPDNSFDLVNARLLIGVLSSDPEKRQWETLVSEIYRILKPGGFIRLVEGEVATVAYAPHLHRLLQAFQAVLFKKDKAFATTELAITAMIDKFIKQGGFINVKKQPYLLNWSAGEKYHKAVADDTMAVIQTMKEQGLLTAIGDMTEEEYTEAFVGTQQELKTIVASWLLVASEGCKPA